MSVRLDLCATETLFREWLATWPDPVDEFEDELAARLGFLRFPTLSYSAGRGLRVRWIDSADIASDLSEDRNLDVATGRQAPEQVNPPHEAIGTGPPPGAQRAWREQSRACPV